MRKPEPLETPETAGSEPPKTASIPRSRLRHAVFTSVMIVGVPLLVLLLIEGASSVVLFARELNRGFGAAPDQSRQRVQYDSLLGWTWRPNVHVPDVWGPGVYFRTNARGFRNNTETTPRPAPGRLRMLCSGDSFTEGAGVDNDHTWCALLERMHPSFETINLGQGGYGLDQAYLRFKRDGRPLDPAIHILGFITDDFRRMGLRQSWYWHKPRLAIRQRVLQVENVPVPRLVSRIPQLPYLLDAVQGFRAVQLLGKLKARLAGQGTGSTVSDTALADIVRAVASDLRSRGPTDPVHILVYLPTLDDYLSHSAETWRERLRASAAPAENVWYLDLVSELRRVSPDSVTAMFIPYSDEQYERRGFGHLTVRGNQWVADKLFQYLTTNPAIARRLEPARLPESR